MNYINYSIELQLIKHSVEKWDDFNMDLYVYVFRRYLETFKILQKKKNILLGGGHNQKCAQPYNVEDSCKKNVIVIEKRKGLKTEPHYTNFRGAASMFQRQTTV